MLVITFRKLPLIQSAHRQTIASWNLSYASRTRLMYLSQSVCVPPFGGYISLIRKYLLVSIVMSSIRVVYLETSQLFSLLLLVLLVSVVPIFP